MKEVYSQSTYDLGYPSGVELHFWHLARNDLIFRWLEPRLSQGDLVMDVGCGTGHVLGSLKSRGIAVRGVEQGAAPVIAGLEADVQTETDLFDLDTHLKQQITAVLLLDVLEHMEQRSAFLKRIYSELPNCRFLIVTVPARMELWSDYDDFWGHHLRYNRPKLERELRDSGFLPDKSSYFFHWVYLASLLTGLLRIPRSNEFAAIKKGSALSILHRIAGFITRLESRIVPGSVAGSSIISVASRRVE